MQIEFEETTEALARELAIEWADEAQVSRGLKFPWQDYLGMATSYIERVRKIKKGPG